MFTTTDKRKLPAIINQSGVNVKALRDTLPGDDVNITINFSPVSFNLAFITEYARIEKRKTVKGETYCLQSNDVYTSDERLWLEIDIDNDGTVSRFFID